MTGSAPRGEGGQASVELAILLPVVVLLLALVVQVGLVARDRVVAIQAARTAARAVIVEPTEDAARSALRQLGPPASTATVQLDGDRSPGDVVMVTVRMRPTAIPLLGRLVAGVELTERFGVLVEGGG